MVIILLIKKIIALAALFLLQRNFLSILNFFAQSKHIKLDLPQAAWLSIFFVGKSVVFHLSEGPELRTHHPEDREKKIKSPAPGRIRTHDLSLLLGVRSAAVLQPMPPIVNFIMHHRKLSFGFQIESTALVPYLATAVWLFNDNSSLAKINRIPIPIPPEEMDPAKISNYQVRGKFGTTDF